MKYYEDLTPSVNFWSPWMVSYNENGGKELPDFVDSPKIFEVFNTLLYLRNRHSVVFTNPYLKKI